MIGPEPWKCSTPARTDKLKPCLPKVSSGSFNMSPQQPLLADLDTEYRGSSGQIDEVTCNPFSTRFVPSTPNTPPTDSTLSKSRSVLHARAKSLAAYMPRLGSIAVPISPTKDRCPQSSRHSPNKLFGDLFSGESTPVRIGVALQPPVKDETEYIMEYASHFTARPNSSSRRKAAMVGESQADSNRKSWFSRKSNAPSTAPSSLADDEILKIDIHSALFPYGPPDAHSPHAFNDLLLNATALLEKMQLRYRETATNLASIRPEMEVQREEVEEVETRSRHLKLQLEDMCRKAEEQDRTMKEMAEQLAIEKLRYQEERGKGSSSLHLIKGSADESASCSIAYGGPHFLQSRRKRVSAGSSITDSGFESNADSASIFSADGQEDMKFARLQSNDAVCNSSTLPSQHINQNDSSAYATADALRHENHYLREQLEMMQKNIQGCIDFVETVAL